MDEDEEEFEDEENEEEEEIKNENEEEIKINNLREKDNYHRIPFSKFEKFKEIETLCLSAGR